MEEQITKAIWTIVGLAIAIITYYLKKADKKIDCNSDQIIAIQKCYVTADELAKIEEKLRGDFQRNEKGIMDKLVKIEDEVKMVQINYIHKDDFFKEMAKMDSKLQRLLDIVIEDRKVGK